MTAPRLFLVAPEIPPAEILDCLRSACGAGDVASLVVPPEQAGDVTKPAQTMNVAVLTTGDPRNAARYGCDGLHIDGGLETYREARSSAGKDRIVGAFCGSSRHLAMELAEAGSDYIAFSQNRPAVGGEPIVAWWSSVFEIPCVAFDPVDESGLDTLLPQNPDFIRPSDNMWSSPEDARRIVASITARLNR
jgi:thiamine-phosphate pyrophosphorylase